jgi:O-antigen/teichoic acid export membrane protein
LSASTKHFKSTAVYTVLGFLPLGVSFILSPVYTYFLSAKDYGIVGLSTLLAAYLNIFLVFGADSAFSRYYFEYYRNKKILNAFLSTTIITVFIFSAVTGLLLYFFGEPIMLLFFKTTDFSFYPYIFFTFLTSVFSMVMVIVQQYYRNSENLRGFSILSVSNLVASTAASLLGVVYLKYAATGSIGGKMAGTLLVMIPYSIYILYSTGFVFRPAYFKKLLTYGFPVAIYLLVAIIFDNYDKVIIENEFGLSKLGIYNLAFTIAAVVNVFLAAIQAATYPTLYRNWSSHEAEKNTETRNTFTYIHLANCIVICIITALFRPFMEYFINKTYIEAALYIPILALMFIPRSYFITYSTSLFYYKKTILLPLINLISLGAGILAIKFYFAHFGITGICCSVIFIKSVQAALAYFSVHIIERGSFRDKFALNRVHLINLVTFFLVTGATLFNACYSPSLVVSCIVFCIPLVFMSAVLYFLFKERLKKLFLTLKQSTLG